MLKLIRNFTKKEWALMFISALFIIFQVWLDLKMPDYMSEITQLVQTEGSSLNEILTQGIYMLLCAGGSLVSSMIVGYFVANLAAQFSMKVRKKLFDKVENLSMHEVKMFSTSSLITRTTNDITQVQMLIAMGLQMMIKAPITAIWAITKILNKSWQWSAILMKNCIIKIRKVRCLPRQIFCMRQPNILPRKMVRSRRCRNYPHIRIFWKRRYFRSWDCRKTLREWLRCRNHSRNKWMQRVVTRSLIMISAGFFVAEEEISERNCKTVNAVVCKTCKNTAMAK